MSSIAVSARGFHEDQYGEPPFVVVSSPGVVNLFGDFTESVGGCLLGFCLSQRLAVSLSPRNDNQVRFTSREFNEKKRCTVQTLRFRKEDRWANFAKGALAVQLDHQASQGLALSVVSEIPPSAGLSSSQALTLSTLLAISEFQGFRLDLEEAARLALHVERDFVHHRCLESSFVPLLKGRHHELLFQDLRSGQIEFLDCLDGPRFFLILPRLPPMVYENLVHDLGQLILQAQRFITGDRPGLSLRDFDRGDIRSRLGNVPEAFRRRALYLVEEIARTQEAASLVRQRDWRSVGRLMVRSHEGLRDLMEISCPEMDWLVRRSAEIAGVYGARMVGNENGSCVLVLSEDSAQGALEEMLIEYERIFGFHPSLLPTYPSARVEFHSEAEILLDREGRA